MIKASLLILEKDGKILFAKRSKKKDSLPGKWSLPAEKLEAGETLEGAARRCAQHELNIILKDVKPFDEYHFKDEKEDKALYFFKAHYQGIPKIIASDELVELEYHSFAEFFKKYPDKDIGHGLQYLRRELGY